MMFDVYVWISHANNLFIKVVIDENVSKGYRFVHYATFEALRRQLAHFMACLRIN